MLKIKLSWAEVTFACQAGVMRHLVNCRDKKNQSNLESEKWTAFDRHAMGALAEYAVAKWLNLHWEPHTPNVCGGDLGGSQEIEVRWTNSWSGHLLIQKEEKDITRRFVLVTGDLQTRTPKNHVVLNVPGWLVGLDGQRDEWWRTAKEDGRYCYWVPQKALLPMEKIRCLND